MRLLVFLGYLIPKNLVSFILGVVVRIRLPSLVRKPLLKGFVKVFGIDMTEASMKIDEYQTIEDVFTRELKTDARPIKGAICSPADGKLTHSDSVKNSLAVQAKGIEYSLDELVFGGESQSPSKLAWYTTIYLAPHNYHRVHSPVKGSLERVRYFPGQLWPVNQPFVRYVPKLFVRNERLVFDIKVQGEGYVYVVMVGALNVGRISAKSLPDFVTNSLERQLGALKVEHFLGTPIPVEAGMELGTFMLGSTAVVVFEESISSRYRILQTSKDRDIRVGETLLT